MALPRKRRIIIVVVIMLVVVMGGVVPTLFKKTTVGNGDLAMHNKKVCDFLIGVIEKSKSGSGDYPQSIESLYQLFGPDLQNEFKEMNPAYTLVESGTEFTLAFTCEDEGDDVKCTWESKEQSWYCGAP